MGDSKDLFQKVIHDECLYNEHVGFKDYQASMNLFGKWSKPNIVTHIRRRNGVQLYATWVHGGAELLSA